MTYTNVTNSIAVPIKKYANDCANPMDYKDKTFFNESVLSRGAHFTAVPVCLFTNVVDTAIGLGAGVATLCTLGMHQPTYKFTLDHLSSANHVISSIYFGLLRTINPRSKFDDSVYQNGIFAGVVAKPILECADAFRDSDSIFKRHVASRLTYALAGLSCIVTRVADGIIGLGAAGLSVICFGTNHKLNSLAVRGLQATRLITDLFISAVVIINPWAGLKKQYDIIS